MAHTIMWLISMLPIYIVLIWTYFYPEESLLLGQRWKYKDEPEFTEEALAFTRFGSVIGLFLITIVLVASIIDAFYAMLLTLVFFVYIFYSIFKFRKKVLDED